jgi:hypothetical protein
MDQQKGTAMGEEKKAKEGKRKSLPGWTRGKLATKLNPAI